MPASRIPARRPGKLGRVALKKQARPGWKRTGGFDRRGKDPSWTKVERKKTRKKPQVQEVRDAKEVLKEQAPSARKATCSSSWPSQYSDVLKAMQSDAKLMDLGADIHSIRGTRTGEMILELKCNKERKGAAYKSLMDEVLGEGVEVRARTVEMTLKVKNLEEIIEGEEIVSTNAATV